jgi:calcineurin-like phosphoesterase family protein
MSRTFFSSDPHYDHRNIIEYCGRPFNDVDHMNETMIERWNEVVGDDDLVYLLGDFTLGAPETWAKFAHRLRGRNLLVPGNHDRLRITDSGAKKAAGFEVLDSNLVVPVDGLNLWLNHFPLRSHDRRGYHRPLAPGDYDVALCGHAHQHWRVHDGVVNVGVDVWDFRPISLADILGALAEGDDGLGR